ncbi:MAG: A24 family peptidase [Lachnospiraceae bacterium]|nr:A24 family peptidase [Lachnospiraceae bacterium]
MSQYVLTGTVLLVCVYTDIRYRKIYKWVIIAHLAASMILRLVMRDGLSGSIFTGTVPGLLCLALSFGTGQAIGYGDALLILSCGFSIGLQQGLAVLYTAFLCAGVWAAGLLLFRRGKRKTEIPFAPFMLAGAVIYGLGAMT